MDVNETRGEFDIDRRRFLNFSVGAIAMTLATRESRAAELPHVAPTDPTAQALGYVEDATTVDAKKFPQHQPTQTCMNCQQFTQPASAGYGPCLIFAGKAVSERGWCAAYVPKA